MAMMLITSIFERTWGQRAGARPKTEYWQELIQAVRKKYPDMLFVAEAYWDLESALQQQGFNYCYDKRLYDRLAHENASSVRLHLRADISYQEKLVRFIENHDEPRAAATFSAQQQRSAAVTILTLPGAKLLHEGQLDGSKAKLPVQLGRRPIEPADKELRTFYLKLIEAVNGNAFPKVSGLSITAYAPSLSLEQYLRPIEDITPGGWLPSSGAELWPMLDEGVPNDSDYIYGDSSAGTCEVAVESASDPQVSTGHKVRYRIRRDAGGPNLIVSLYCETTLIASWTHADVPTVYTTYEQTLSGAQADNIFDYSALRVRFEETA